MTARPTDEAAACHEDSDNDLDDEICVVDDEQQLQVLEDAADDGGNDDAEAARQNDVKHGEAAPAMDEETEAHNNSTPPPEDGARHSNALRQSDANAQMTTNIYCGDDVMEHDSFTKVHSDAKYSGVSDSYKQLASNARFPLVAAANYDELEPGEIIHSVERISSHNVQASLQASATIDAHRMNNNNKANVEHTRRTTDDCSDVTDTDKSHDTSRDCESTGSSDKDMPKLMDIHRSPGNGLMAPSVGHPMFPYLYYPSAMFAQALPYSPESLPDPGVMASERHAQLARLYQQLAATAQAKSLSHPSPIYPHSVDTQAMTPPALQLTGYSPLWLQYYTALSHSNADAVLRAVDPLHFTSHVSPTLGPIYPSKTALSSFQSRVSPYTLPELKRLNVNHRLTSPHDAEARKSESDAKMRDIENARLSPARRSPDSSCSPTQSARVQRPAESGNGSQLENIQNMVQGLERQEQQNVADSLTTLQA